MQDPISAALNAKRRLEGDGGDSMAGIAKNYTFRAVGQNSASGKDVAAFFNVPTDTLLAGEVAATITQTSQTGFTLLQMAEHFQTHPAPLVNWNLPFATNAAVISTMKFLWVRKEPDNTQASKDTDVATQLTPGDFQSARVQFKGDGKRIYDGQTYLRWMWDSQSPAVTVMLSLSFGPSVDLRAMAREAAPVLIG
jgi:hypothetical protein